MKKTLIFGNSNFSVAMRKYIQKYTNFEIAGYTINEKFITRTIFDGFTVYPFEELSKVFPPEKANILLTIGYGDMNDLRMEKYNEIKEKGYELINFIHPSAIVDCESIGDANIVLENVILAQGTSVGSGNIIWGNVHLAHGASINNFNFLGCNSLLGGEARIENNCFLGLSAVIGSARKLASYTFVGIGANVNVNSVEYDVFVNEKAIKLEKSSHDMMQYLERSK